MNQQIAIKLHLSVQKSDKFNANSCIRKHAKP